MFCVRFYGGYPHIADFILPAAERYVNQIRLNGYQIIFFFLIIRDGIENRNAFIRGDKKMAVGVAGRRKCSIIVFGCPNDFHAGQSQKTAREVL